MKSKKFGRMSGREPFIDSVFAEELEKSRPRRGSGDRRDDRKAQQLCRQVQRALSLALAGECNDDVLRELYVESVEPAPDASRLLVRVVLPRDPQVAAIDVLERLGRFHGLLRSSVAAVITRKRAPELMFVPIAAGEVMP